MAESSGPVLLRGRTCLPPLVTPLRRYRVMPVSDICVADNDSVSGARRTIKNWGAYSRFLAALRRDCRSYSCLKKHALQRHVHSKSGNKLPTIVQKVYLRLGKKLHEFVNKF